MSENSALPPEGALPEEGQLRLISNDGQAVGGEREAPAGDRPQLYVVPPPDAPRMGEPLRTTLSPAYRDIGGGDLAREMRLGVTAEMQEQLAVIREKLPPADKTAFELYRGLELVAAFGNFPNNDPSKFVADQVDKYAGPPGRARRLSFARDHSALGVLKNVIVRTGVSMQTNTPEQADAIIDFVLDHKSRFWTDDEAVEAYLHGLKNARSLLLKISGADDPSIDDMYLHPTARKARTLDSCLAVRP